MCDIFLGILLKDVDFGINVILVEMIELFKEYKIYYIEMGL